MRPVRRGPRPNVSEWTEYKQALGNLSQRLGTYCSYCERPILSGIEVEHIQPKKPFPGLKLEWTNFLLGCKNCNSTKGDKTFGLDEVFLPDRDNTLLAFSYQADGRIGPARGLSPTNRRRALATLSLVGLNKVSRTEPDPNLRLVALTREDQRKQAWQVAERSRNLLAGLDTQAMREQIVETAKAWGHFSIWLTVFEKDHDLRNRLIDVFPGTRESGCFDPVTTRPISPHPNTDHLPYGGKL